MANKTERVGESESTPEAGVVKLGLSELDMVVTKKSTCPFLGSAIATWELPVRNHPGNPLASVEDVIRLGNTGGGKLGIVLGIFARGNHGKMRGHVSNANTLDIHIPFGLFSLELPGSQGSHAGHSGILQGDPAQLDSGRFSDKDFERLEARSRGGFIKRSDIVRFIVENIKRDPGAKFFPLKKWAKEVVNFSWAVIRKLSGRNQDNKADAEIHRSLTSIIGGNHLLASAGEFGLLLAFLHNSPRTRHGIYPAFSMEEVTLMFRDKRLPEGWEEWKKTLSGWLLHTAALFAGAAAELVRLRIGEFWTGRHAAPTP